MMKTLDFRLASSAAQGKAVTTIPVRPRLPVAARPCIKRLYGNRSVSRTGVKTHAAESGAVAPRSEPIPLTALKAGDEFEGRVVKVEKFGAFVNFGAAKDGLVHISQLSDKYVQDATKAVKPQDSVKVRVMSADPATGRIALSMKGMEATPNETAPMATMETMEEENEEGGDEEVQMELPVEAEEGHQIVDADEEPDVLYQMLEEDPEITLESVAAFEAMDFKDVNLNVDVSESMPAGAIGDAISGTVSRVEDYGVFVEFGKGGRTYIGLLPTDEAKVPAAALSPEKLAQYVPAGSPVPTYVSESIDMDDKISNFYKIGDTVQALILEYTDQNKIALTQWADWEVDEDAAQLGEGFIEDEADPVSLDPLEMIGEEESGDDEDADAEAMKRDDEMVLDEKTGLRKGDVKESYALMGRHGRIMSPSMMENFMTFSSRPLNKIDVGSLNARHIEFTTRDMENDEVTLNDYWQPIETTSHSKRVAAFVKDLMSADEDEDEVPARAYRAPLVKAAAAENISAAAVKDLRGQTGAGMMDCKKALAECGGDAEQAKDWLRKKGLSGADKKMGRTAAEGAIASYIHPGSRLGVLMEVNCETDFVAASDNFQRLVGEIGMILASCPDVAVVNPEDVPADLLAREREVEMGKEELKSKPEGVRGKIVEGRIQKIKDNWALVNQDSLRAPGKKMSEVIKETISQVGENIQVRRFERFNLGEGIEKKQSNLAEEVAHQMAAGETAAKQEEKKLEPAPAPPAAEEAVPQVEVSAKAVKELRMKMGAGMMDCKKALAVNNNDMDAAVNWLRKKGLASADKKAGRVAAEGVIASYIHPGSRLGVLMEVNCETDFVAASDKFVQLVQTLGMQIAQSNATYVSPEDIPAEVFVREKELEMQREDIKSKPEAIRAKIAEGRAAKIGQEMALYPQPFLADNSKTVEEAIKEATAAIGEKISLRRFVKYSLGEGIEKKQSNLAEEVASFAQKASQ